jgi:hypothetical protein
MKQCKKCGKDFRQYKTTDKYCSPACKLSEHKPIKQQSKKRAKQDVEYRQARRVYLAHNWACKVCKRAAATQVHHKNRRNGDRLNDERYWLAVCGQCHNEIHDKPTWAKEKGFLL